jgi:hypothetical protein
MCPGCAPQQSDLDDTGKIKAEQVISCVTRAGLRLLDTPSHTPATASPAT